MTPLSHRDKIFGRLLKEFDNKDFLTRIEFEKDLVEGDWYLVYANAICPFEGCWNQPNFWFLSPNFQDFLPLFATHKRWVEGMGFEEWLDVVGYERYWGDVDIYVIRKETLLTEHVHPTFCRYISDTFKDVFKETGKRYHDPKIKCDICGNVTDEPHTYDGDYYGIGGVAVATQKLYCEGCVCGGCDTCGVPMREDEGQYITIKGDDYESKLCPDCYEWEKGKVTT